MSQAEAETRPALSLDDIREAAAEIARAEDIAGKASRLLARLQIWAAPSLVFCMRKDVLTESGWRVVTEVASGHIPPGFERFVAKLVDESPAAKSKPLLVRPAGEELPGFKVRDTWIIPWSCGEGAQGFLVLRGVPSTSAPNLGDAVALAAQPLWPALAARNAGPELTPAERFGRLDSAVGEIRRLVERVEGELRREQQNASSAPPAPAAAPEPATAEQQQKIEALTKEIEDKERRRQEAEAQAEFARGEAGTLRARVEELEAERGGGERARRETTALEEKLAASDKARDDAQRARDDAQRARDEAQKARDEVQKARDEADQARTAAEAERDRLRTQMRELEDERRGSDQVRLEAGALQDKLDTAEKARAAAEADRDKLRGQMGQLWASIESLQKEVQAGKDLAAEQVKRVEEQTRQSQDMFARMQAQLREAGEKQQEAEDRAESEETRWNGALATFREALRALRRTPFVPPTLRIGLGDLEALVEPEGQRSATRSRVLFLDRDLSAIDVLARELEGAGFDVLIAHYPEEVGLFLKTPDSRGLTALVCDVMAFRPDQNLTDLFKGWRQDAANLSVLISFRADNTSEAEKAQRLPSTLAAGYLPRPLTKDGIAEAVGAIAARKQR